MNTVEPFQLFGGVNVVDKKNFGVRGVNLKQYPVDIVGKREFLYTKGVNGDSPSSYIASSWKSFKRCLTMVPLL
jgi:hypothetical protein